MRKTLVKFDTDHIKDYVFGTDRLKEIRGASSLLDTFNRVRMETLAKSYCEKKVINYKKVYLFAGTGLFLLMTEKETAENFGRYIQKKYYEETRGCSSITYVVYELSESLSNNIDFLWNKNLSKEFKVIHYCVHEAKDNPPDVDITTLPSHPFMYTCISCGLNYAQKGVKKEDDLDEPGIYCAACYRKQIEDHRVKRWLQNISEKDIKEENVLEFLANYKSKGKQVNQDSLWPRILSYLDKEKYDFKISEKGSLPERPSNFNIFRDFSTNKDCIGLIYADANNMQVRLGKLETLLAWEQVSQEVDELIHVAMSKAICKHLPLVQPKNNKNDPYLFPFDILLLGGDDIVMVTDASKVMDVAYTIAQEFYNLTEASDIIHSDKFIKDPAKDTACTLSIGVAIAPIKYPFNHLRHMAEDSLQEAKKESLEIRKRFKEEQQVRISQSFRVNDSCINFVVATGGNMKNFGDVKEKVYKGSDGKHDFYATLRPYDLKSLELLLNAIKEGHKRNLGRTKLHALREAVLEKNLTTSVSHGMAVLRNWRMEQRTFVMTALYEFGGRYANAIPKTDIKDPINGFPSITFPWFVDQQETKEKESKTRVLGEAEGKVYRTAFLDFVELYDFVGREDGNVREEN